MFDLAALHEMWNNAWPVISLLLVSSVLSGAIILERLSTLSRAQFDRHDLMQKLRRLLAENRRDQALAQVRAINRPIGRVLSAVLDASAQSRAAEREFVERVGDREIRS
ncbi:MAG TPA: hypothetical protein VMU17_04650, partial [Elusimicrobiota bacterium]|nr:hypothetical protein [Elusimicrobiota bacterium]